MTYLHVDDINPRWESSLLVTRPTPPISRFIKKCLDGHFNDTPIGIRDDIIERLATFALNCSSIEIEGKEMSMGILLAKKSKLEKCELIVPALSESIKKAKIELKISGVNEEYVFEQIRDIVRKMNKTIFGWTPGYYEQPIIVIEWSNSLPIVGAGLLQSALEAEKEIEECDDNSIVKTGLDSHVIFTPHEAYKRLACDKESFAVWIKPHGALRFYGSHSFIGEMMRLRDAAGWSVRYTSQLSEYILSRLPNNITFLKSGEKEDEKKNIHYILENYFIDACITLSEEKKGAGIYILPEKALNEIKMQKQAHSIAENTKKDLNNIYEAEWKVYLEQDGAVVLNENGQLLSVGCYFHSPGGRRKTAEFMCGCFKAVAFIVSEDGGIYFHSPGIKEEESMVPEDDKENILKENKEFIKNFNPKLVTEVSVGRYVRLDFFKSSCT